MYILWGTNTSTNNFQFQGLKMRHIVKGALRTLKGCLYESQYGTFGGTGRYSGSRHVYVSITLIAFRLYEAGTFFVPSHLGRILHSAPGFHLKRDDFCHINTLSRLTGTNSIFHFDNSCTYLDKLLFILLSYLC